MIFNDPPFAERAGFLIFGRMAIIGYKNNPRKITDEQMADLTDWMVELGDLGGIVINLGVDFEWSEDGVYLNRSIEIFDWLKNNDCEVVSGNQRDSIININQRVEAETMQFHSICIPITSKGTVAKGTVDFDGERFNIRFVSWDRETADKAVVIANKAGGKTDFGKLAQFEFDNGFLSKLFTNGELSKMDKGGKGMKRKGKVPFSRELLLEHNYVVITFDNVFDWNVAKEFFGLGEVKSGIKTTKSQKVGIGRVVGGGDFLNKIQQLKGQSNEQSTDEQNARTEKGGGDENKGGGDGINAGNQTED